MWQNLFKPFTKSCSDSVPGVESLIENGLTTVKVTRTLSFPTSCHDEPCCMKSQHCYIQPAALTHNWSTSHFVVGTFIRAKWIHWLYWPNLTVRLFNGRKNKQANSFCIIHTNRHRIASAPTAEQTVPRRQWHVFTVSCSLIIRLSLGCPSGAVG